MSLIASLVLAASASTVTLPACSWDKPGANPFTGDLVAAVDRYQDIPEATRAKLKQRLRARSYDDIAVIRRDRIDGKGDYGPELRDMHFAAGSICRSVTRSKWTAQHQERGLVYCEDGHCLIVPTVCRNLSRITRTPPRPVAGAAGDEAPLGFEPPAAGVAAAPAVPAGDAPLSFEAPAAGGAAPTTFASAAQAPAVGFTGLAGPAAGAVAAPSLGSTGGVPPLPLAQASSLPLPPAPPIPEPSTWLLMGLGLAALALQRRSKLAR